MRVVENTVTISHAAALGATTVRGARWEDTKPTLLEVQIRPIGVLPSSDPSVQYDPLFFQATSVVIALEDPAGPSGVAAENIARYTFPIMSPRGLRVQVHGRNADVSLIVIRASIPAPKVLQVATRIIGDAMPLETAPRTVHQARLAFAGLPLPFPLFATEYRLSGPPLDTYDLVGSDNAPLLNPPSAGLLTGNANDWQPLPVQASGINLSTEDQTLETR